MAHSRRNFLKTSSLLLLPNLLPGSLAQKPPTAEQGVSGSKRLVVIFLKGAMDGVMACQPMSNQRLLKLRPNLCLPNTDLNPLGHGWGFHPAFKPLMPFYEKGQLALVQGVGLPQSTRSHFQAQDAMAIGSGGQKTSGPGWMNTLAGTMIAPDNLLGLLAFTPTMPRILMGSQLAVTVEGLDPKEPDRFLSNLQGLYNATADQPLGMASKRAFLASQQIGQWDQLLAARNRRHSYPNTPLGKRLQRLAGYLKMGSPLQLAFIESDGWDTHRRQGQKSGRFARMAEQLSQAIASFWEDCKGMHEDLVVLTMSEFGRTIKENGARGSDHGRGTCFLVLGGQINGGHVHGAINSSLDQVLENNRDLAVTTDYRSVLSSIISIHLQRKESHVIFPNWRGKGLPALFKS